jgi:hypothetical protein
VGGRRVHKQDRPAIAPPSHPCNKFPMAAAIATPCAPLIIISPQPSHPHPLLDHSRTVCTPRKTKHATAPGSDRPTEQARQAQIAHTALKLPPSSTQHNLLISFLDRTNATITVSQTKQFLLAEHEKWPKQEKTHTKEEMDVRRE